jgi:3-deoxy-D-manno-octulosonic-acid transferase
VLRFIEHWRPDIALWTESEFWPNIILETHKAEIPLVLLNGRISDKSYAKWQIAPSLMKNILNCFNECFGQSEEDVLRLKKLGAPKAKNLGNLKFSVPPLPVDIECLNDLQSQIRNRPLWLAASTHFLEENMIASIHEKLRNFHKDILTIIVPRQVNRGEKIARLLKNKNISCALRSRNNPIAPNTQIYIADTMGELGLFFSLSDIVFMGKSLVPHGGQNPLEPLKLGCAVVHGPYMTNFRWICQEMQKCGCSIEVKSILECSESISKLINKIPERKKMIQQGNKFIDSQSEVVSLVTREILTTLDSKYAPT